MANVTESLFTTIKTTQVLGKMEQIEIDIPAVDPVNWEIRWINLKCWLELYGE